jgi:hypothetical protein
MRELGGRRKPSPQSPNGGWRDDAFRGYADYMQTPPFTRALNELEATAEKHVTAIMCAEALWWRCHRRLISDALLILGWRVEHLGIGSSPVPHELTPFAVADDTIGRLTYPPLQTQLPTD